MRPRRGQKQRQKRSCHGFCPLRGRIVCASTKPRVSLAALACPGLGACCPCGARVERLSPIGKNSSPEPNDFWACVLLQAGQDAFNERPEEWQGARRSTRASEGIWQGIMRSTRASEGIWQGIMRSTHAPKGQQAPSPGQVSEANDTLGYEQGFPMRPRRGQKQRQKRSCHGFCPLRGRIVCASTKPRVSLAALACPGLGACCPCGARVERL